MLLLRQDLLQGVFERLSFFVVELHDETASPSAGIRITSLRGSRVTSNTPSPVRGFIAAIQSQFPSGLLLTALATTDPTGELPSVRR